ncbi:alpha/beta fold hydrolase [Streptomyces piniterrae]|uniref:Alpha/beta fold hydrolase n=1 Tax=Streptomyces piniterrae TaxID=2571125 RepID=A0A4U0MU34_9ACTN|nr:alpha/beta hydrolase [Streptomyces piniterrae]TJZ44479.1 alpha/beta fold hydrolase [Streptomyces piniterrae]
MASFVLPHALRGGGSHKVIAVHGWFADRSAFDAVLPDLDQDAFQYALVDLRGYGDAKGALGAYTTGEGADDVLALADRLGWERFSVIGHSMGGSVAQRVLAAAPHRVRRIVGISPVPASGLPLPPQQWELFSSAAHAPENRRAIIDFTTGGRRPAAWLERMVRRSLECSDPKAFRAWLDSWAGEDFHTEAEGAQAPALAVVGALDPALTTELMRQTWMRWYRSGELAELRSAGHYAMDETPLELIRTVEDFLRADGEGGEADGDGRGSDRPAAG